MKRCDKDANCLEVQSLESYRDVDVNPALRREDRQTVDDLLSGYSDVLSFVSGHTHVLEHEYGHQQINPKE